MQGGLPIEMPAVPAKYREDRCPELIDRCVAASNTSSPRWGRVVETGFASKRLRVRHAWSTWPVEPCDTPEDRVGVVFKRARMLLEPFPDISVDPDRWHHIAPSCAIMG